MSFKGVKNTTPSALPHDYDRQADFTDYEENHPGENFSAADLDAEFNAIEQAIDETQDRLSIIQRDDGALRNGVVGEDQLTSDLVSQIESSDLTLLEYLHGGTGSVARPLSSKLREVVSITDFDAVADFNPLTGEGTDNWAAIQAALNTGKDVFVPAGDIVVPTVDTWYGYRIDEKELLIKTKNQILFGSGMGASYGSTQAKDHSSKGGLYFTGTGTKYIHTRRLPRASALDPQDDPISTAINIQHEGVEIRDLAINLYCDYTDNDPDNLGDDWDVGIFIGTRPQVKLHNVRVIGYFRKASIYLDGTHGFNLPQLLDGDGEAYPASSYLGGFDQNYWSNVFASGGHKGLFIAGPIFDTANYYDEQLGAAVADVRGRAGGADSHFHNCCIFGPDHHSLQRRRDPVAPLDFSAEDIDDLACAIAIDAAGQPSSFGQPLRRILFTNCRVQSFEMVRIAIRNIQELYFHNLHTEPHPTFTVKNTSGVVIDHDDVTTHDYGSIAVQSITNDATKNRGVFIHGINFRIPEEQWFDDVLGIGCQITDIYGESISDTYFNKFGRSLFRTGFTVRAEDNGASEGPQIDLDRDSDNPDVGDVLASQRFLGRNSVGAAVLYASVRAAILTKDNGTESGEYNILTRVAGSIGTRLRVAQGLYMPGATGGDKGAGAGNFTALYINNVDVPTTVTSSYTGTLTGLTTSPTVAVNYTKTGDVVTLTVAASVTGTSNTLGFTITGAPVAIRPTNDSGIAYCRLTNNGADVAAEVYMSTAGTLTFMIGGSTTGFTNSGTKGVGTRRITLTYKVTTPA